MIWRLGRMANLPDRDADLTTFLAIDSERKTVYLLDRLGLNSGFDCYYCNYGPYSRDLDNATADALSASRAAAARGEFATDEQVRAIWAKHGL